MSWKRGLALRSLVVAVCLGVTAALWSQSIVTEGNIETDAQLVSKVANGTAPLAVSSQTKVTNLNADKLDGVHMTHFAYLSDLLAAKAELDNPDPPCFDSSHRFVNCSNGTVTDTVTGLIWLYDANCFGQQDWPTANELAAGLFDGCSDCGGTDNDCGLSDGSRPGDWRLPTKEEWEEMVDDSCGTAPKIVGNVTPTPGCYSAAGWASDVESSNYWSSLTNPDNTEYACFALLNNGLVHELGDKTSAIYVWPVRGRQ